MFEVLLLAFALSMDAFAVAIGLGVKSQKFNFLLGFKVALFFGAFQALMPLLGYLASVGLGSLIESIDHWIAFVLLSLIGAKMFYESLGSGIENEIADTTNRVLLLLAIATSIDAMAAGFSLSLLSLNPFASMMIIGIVTFCFGYLGVYIGSKSGAYLESKAEILGGVVLIAIGVKILFEHTGLL